MDDISTAPDQPQCLEPILTARELVELSPLTERDVA